jgi:hypothetical protein
MRHPIQFAILAGCVMLLAACGGGATATPPVYTDAEIAAIFLRAASEGDIEEAQTYYCDAVRDDGSGDIFVNSFGQRDVKDILCAAGSFPNSAYCTFTRQGIDGEREEADITINVTDGKYCGTFDTVTEQ